MHSGFFPFHEVWGVPRSWGEGVLIHRTSLDLPLTGGLSVPSFIIHTLFIHKEIKIIKCQFYLQSVESVRDPLVWRTSADGVGALTVFIAV